MNRIEKYWPEFFLKILDFVELANTENKELEVIQAAKEEYFNDKFVLTSSVEAVKRREKILGIQADPNTETLDFRRKRIINRYSTKPPFTKAYLQQRLDFLVGNGRAIAEVDSFILTVTAAIYDASIFKEVERTIYAIKPANMIYQQQTAIENTITLDEHISKRELDRQTILGIWPLGAAPFAELQQEVVIK
ncbi:putative phage tail protein [Alkaliphilus peptidifermentans]|uniref:Phage portal protein n=1 Tax=Alkaliphilus peptidifermentans DSM 18978 TaxID=1120976 RepID=A0A1G5JXN5_9FIRM|nr:putative phage tail protein [Alkaliphilus peptidifermentans]SCY93153.1 hypothetical protein SAMN03080606_03108 [Alkaliphilus peptidifermentans DSM 18978]